MTPAEIRAGHCYLTRAGQWILEVERTEGGQVFYVVWQTSQRCQASLADFAARVDRRFEAGASLDQIARDVG
jgi:hypothetical protein